MSVSVQYCLSSTTSGRLFVFSVIILRRFHSSVVLFRDVFEWTNYAIRRVSTCRVERESSLNSNKPFDEWSRVVKNQFHCIYTDALEETGLKKFAHSSLLTFETIYCFYVPVTVFLISDIRHFSKHNIFSSSHHSCTIR